MKNRITPDIIMSVEYNELRNGDSEIINDINPVFRQVQDIKKKIWKALDMNQYQKYMSLHPDERKQFLIENKDFIPN